MALIRLTLQNRITTLMIVSSVLFVSVFTFIQVNNQLASLLRYDSYRANLSTMIAKNNLESVIRQAGEEDLSRYLQNALKSLVDTGLVKAITVFDPEGKIIASSENLTSGESASYKDLDKIENLKNASLINKWFVSGLDRVRQRLYLYIALSKESGGPLAYVAKLSLAQANVQDALSQVYLPVVAAIVIVILANIVFGYVLSKTVIGPIKILNTTTKIIAGGDLSVRTDINTNDELEELGSTFNYMTEELIKMKERAENANPLTKLPGNIVIHEEVTKRIQENRKFMVIYCDLDNFKAFNDKYGIAKGDEAIKLTAEVFKEAAKTKGNADDFVGHEGGDDFILLTTPEKAQEVADYITCEFDKRIRSLYSQEDLSQGYIVAHARDGSVKQFPIMTISLAGVTNSHRTITSYGEVTNIAAEIKKKAKAVEGSVFVVDKRKL